MTRKSQIEAAAIEIAAQTDRPYVAALRMAEWADCNNSRQSDINELCVKLAKEQTRANSLEAQLAIAVDVLEDLSLACVDIVGQDGFVKTTEAQRAFEALAKIEEMK